MFGLKRGEALKEPSGQYVELLLFKKIGWTGSKICDTKSHTCLVVEQSVAARKQAGSYLKVCVLYMTALLFLCEIKIF